KSADPFATVAGARHDLSAWSPRSRSAWMNGSAFWAIVAAPPLVVGLFFAGARAGESMKKRRAAGKNSPAALAAKALRDAKDAAKNDDAKALAAALERAIHFAIEDATRLKSRGVVADSLPGE